MNQRWSVWGYLGGPEGNEAVVAVYAPIVLDQHGQHSVWSGEALRPLRDHEEVGTPLKRGLQAGPEDVVVVVGEDWRSHFLALKRSLPQGWLEPLPSLPSPVWIATSESARAFRRRAAEAALWVYDRPPDRDARLAALAVLQQDDTLDPVERAVRVLDATFTEGERFWTRLMVEVRMTGLSEAALAKRVMDYRKRAQPERWAPARSAKVLYFTRASLDLGWFRVARVSEGVTVRRGVQIVEWNKRVSKTSFQVELFVPPSSDDPLAKANQARIVTTDGSRRGVAPLRSKATSNAKKVSAGKQDKVSQLRSAHAALGRARAILRRRKKISRRNNRQLSR